MVKLREELHQFFEVNMNMRARSVVLREIARLNLDPKEAYVAGKNGVLVPKKPSKVEQDKQDKSKNSEKKTENQDSDVVSETLSESETTEVAEQKKQKSPPPKKKKTVTE